MRIIGRFIAIDNKEKSRDCPSSSNNPVVWDNRNSDNRDSTVLFTVVRVILQHFSRQILL